MKTITDASVYILTLAEAKAQLNIETSFTGDDDLLTAMISAAQVEGENLTQRCWTPRTYEIVLDGFSDTMELPRPPLVSVESVKYLDADNVEQTLSTDVYEVDLHGLVGAVRLKDGQSWPAALARWNAVTIRFVAGYTASGSPETSDAPEALKQWARVRVASLYEQREGFVTGTVLTAMDRGFVHGLLDPFIVPGVV